jgi:hypothetical protein
VHVTPLDESGPELLPPLDDSPESDSLPLPDPELEPPLDDPPEPELLPVPDPELVKPDPLDDEPLDQDEDELPELEPEASLPTASAVDPSSPGKSPMPRSEPHPATGHRAGASAIRYESRARRSDRERSAGVTGGHHVAVTATGVEEFVVVPLPSSPLALWPQHSTTAPPESSAQAE